MKYTAIACSLVLLIWGFPFYAVKAETVTVSAGAATLLEVSGKEVLFEKAADERRPMASTTKLMTALLAAECGDWDKTVCFTADMMAEGSSLGLRVGDTMSLRDAVCAMLLCSGNDAANAVALTVAPTYEAFAEMMNNKARLLGMVNTSFVTPSGLDAEGHKSTAHDMALLGAAVVNHPDLATMCKAKAAIVTIADRKVTVTNHNRLLSIYPDAVGLKTGFTKKAGRCLVSAAMRDGVTLVAVTLNAPDDWDDHVTMLEYGFSQRKAISFPELSLSTVPLVGGVKSEMTLQFDDQPNRVVSTTSNETITATVFLPSFLFAPVNEGDVVGHVEYQYKGEVFLASPIYAKETIAARPTKSKKAQFWCYVHLLWVGFFQ